tara:strand:+ start:14748 stop:15155 length:408 start_codon:yes stop_codon:yes gene_type:complete
MKFKVLSIITFFICFLSTSQEKKAEIKFDENLIDYGEIEYNSDGKRTFKFTNIGEAPLVFNRISSSCGCTVPKKPEQPIKPGESAEIEVEYDTKRIGVFIKAISVSSNAVNSNVVLRIKGEVLEEEEEDDDEKKI